MTLPNWNVRERLEKTADDLDLYELLGGDRFDPDVRALGKAISTAVREVHPFQQHPQLARSAIRLQMALARAAETLRHAPKLRSHHRQLLEKLSKSIREKGISPAGMSDEEIRTSLQIHASSVAVVKEYLCGGNLDQCVERLAEIARPGEPAVTAGRTIPDDEDIDLEKIFSEMPPLPVVASAPTDVMFLPDDFRPIVEETATAPGAKEPPHREKPLKSEPAEEPASIVRLEGVHDSPRFLSRSDKLGRTRQMAIGIAAVVFLGGMLVVGNYVVLGTKPTPSSSKPSQASNHPLSHAGAAIPGLDVTPVSPSPNGDPFAGSNSLAKPAFSPFSGNATPAPADVPDSAGLRPGEPRENGAKSSGLRQGDGETPPPEIPPASVPANPTLPNVRAAGPSELEKSESLRRWQGISSDDYAAENQGTRAILLAAYQSHRKIGDELSLSLKIGETTMNPAPWCEATPAAETCFDQLNQDDYLTLYCEIAAGRVSGSSVHVLAVERFQQPDSRLNVGIQATDVTRRSPTWQHKVDLGPPRKIHWSSDGQYLFVENTRSDTMVYGLSGEAIKPLVGTNFRWHSTKPLIAFCGVGQQLQFFEAEKRRLISLRKRTVTVERGFEWRPQLRGATDMLVINSNPVVTMEVVLTGRMTRQPIPVPIPAEPVQRMSVADLKWSDDGGRLAIAFADSSSDLVILVLVQQAISIDLIPLSPATKGESEIEWRGSQMCIHISGDARQYESFVLDASLVGTERMPFPGSIFTLNGRLALSRDGKRSARPGIRGVDIYSTDGLLEKTLPLARQLAATPAWSKNDALLAVAMLHQIVIYETQTWQVRHVLRLNVDVPVTIAWHPTAPTLAAACVSNNLAIWDLTPAAGP